MMPTASHHESERTSLPLHKPGTLGVVCMPFGQSCKDASLVMFIVLTVETVVTTWIVRRAMVVIPTGPVVSSLWSVSVHRLSLSRVF